MAITAYTGPPGAGKSHALVREVILSAVLAGRRVISNVDGLNPNAILAYCLEREKQWQVDHADKLGEVLTFHGEDAQLAGFWPTEATERAGEVTTVRPGDLVVFDEWAMFFPTGVKTDAAQRVEDFMRWHRHLTAEGGHATDLAIATQSITDFHRRHRPLISNSYNFKKLTAVGAAGSYTWSAYNGRLQRTAYATGTGKYDPAIFPLYASSSAAGQGKHTELKTNKKESIWSGSTAWLAIGAPIVLLIGGGYGLWSVMTKDDPALAAMQARAAAPTDGQTVAAPAPTRSDWRIVGQITADTGLWIVVASKSGDVRMMRPDAFEFDGERAIAGTVDGQRVVASDGLSAFGQDGSGGAMPSPFGGNYK